MTNKQLVTDLLIRLDPHLDIRDEECLFGRILDDYEEYACLAESTPHLPATVPGASAPGVPPPTDGLLQAAHPSVTRGSVAGSPPTDGLPHLSGANLPFRARRSYSIFDIADNA